jgi:hypothetical protein
MKHSKNTPSVTKGKASFKYLPDEIVFHILTFLSTRDLGRMACSCSRLNKLTQHNSLWRPLHWDVATLEKLIPNISWKSFLAEFNQRVRKGPVVVSIHGNSQQHAQAQTQTHELCSRVIYEFLEKHQVDYFIQVCEFPRILIQPQSKTAQKLECKNVNIDKDRYRGALTLRVNLRQNEEKTMIEVVVCDFFAEKVDGRAQVVEEKSEREANLTQLFVDKWEPLFWEAYAKYLLKKQKEPAVAFRSVVVTNAQAATLGQCHNVSSSEKQMPMVKISSQPLPNINEDNIRRASQPYTHSISGSKHHKQEKSKKTSKDKEKQSQRKKEKKLDLSTLK